MNVGLSIGFGLIIVAHLFLVTGAVHHILNPLKCICGQKIKRHIAGKYGCPNCGRLTPINKK